MIERPSSRILVVDAARRVLLFRFEHRKGALAGQSFWATPGGGLDAGESFEDAARRELREETGIAIGDPGPQIAQRTARFTAPSGESVVADERYFVVRVTQADISPAGRTGLERQVMEQHRWWDAAALSLADEQVWPEDLAAMLIAAGVWSIDK